MAQTISKLAGITDPRSLSFDKGIMQSKTVDNICRLLTQITSSNEKGNLNHHKYTIILVIEYILNQHTKARASRDRRAKHHQLKTKKTTVDAKIKLLNKREKSC